MLHRARPALSVVTSALLVLAGCADETPSTPGRATVLEVIDGDTVLVDIDGRDEMVRLLGVDTPETVHPDRPVECFGPEASTYTAELLPPGTMVDLERDIEARDRFDRLLAHVRRSDDGLHVNLALIEAGMAEALVIEPNLALAPELRAAAARARSDEVGLWGACP